MSNILCFLKKIYFRATSSPANDCSELRSQIYGILQGLATPDEIAMSSGSQPDWARVLTQECPFSLQV